MRKVKLIVHETYQILPNIYGKGGVSLVVDFEDDEMNVYAHGGGGRSSGISYAVGLVGNYEEARDYSEYFLDVGAGMNVGIDHGWDPEMPYDVGTNSVSITFSSGLGFYAGLDYYSKPIKVCAW